LLFQRTFSNTGLKGSLWNHKWFFDGFTLKNHVGFQMAPPCFCVQQTGQPLSFFHQDHTEQTFFAWCVFNLDSQRCSESRRQPLKCPGEGILFFRRSLQKFSFMASLWSRRRPSAIVERYYHIWALQTEPGRCSLNVTRSRFCVGGSYACLFRTSKSLALNWMTA